MNQTNNDKLYSEKINFQGEDVDLELSALQIVNEPLHETYNKSKNLGEKNAYFNASTPILTTGRIGHVHFIGICGCGMSGIAEVMANSGYRVTGSDLGKSPVAERLRQLGITIFNHHQEENIKGADVVVISTAIQEDNPEVVAAHQKRIPVVPRAQMLAELMRERVGIAVAGTHGKTTTTSLVTTLLTEGELDPTFIIGGVLNSVDTNAKLGLSRFLVAEADESDASFLYLSPKISIVTNIDADHLWSYDNDFDNIRKTFVEFLQKLPLDGLAIICIDDEEVRQLLPHIARPVLTYGFSEDADVKITNFSQIGTQTYFQIQYKEEPAVRITLNLPGKHNVLNASAAYAVAKEVGVNQRAILKGFEHFQGVGRRFQLRGLVNLGQGKALLIDDYGHHPREIAATIAAIRLAWPDKRLVMMFQPHRYTRTASLFDDFVDVLSQVDQLVLMDVYAAGEMPIEGKDGPALFEQLKNKSHEYPLFVQHKELAISALSSVVKENDIVLLQGAGDIGGLANQLATQFINEMREN